MDVNDLFFTFYRDDGAPWDDGNTIQNKFLGCFFEGKNIEQVLRSSLLFIIGSTTSETSLGKVRTTSSMD